MKGRKREELKRGMKKEEDTGTERHEEKNGDIQKLKKKGREKRDVGRPWRTQIGARLADNGKKIIFTLPGTRILTGTQKSKNSVCKCAPRSLTLLHTHTLTLRAQRSATCSEG